MSNILYDLAGAQDQRFSPFVWRTKYALAHIGQGFEAIGTCFTDIPTAGDGKHKSLPILGQGGRYVSDSWAIAEQLEKQSLKASLFGSAEGSSFAKFLHDWVGPALLANVLKIGLTDIHAGLAPKDQDYFRVSREKRFGKALEQVCPDPELPLAAIKQNIFPVTRVLADQAFLGGRSANYADYIVFSAFQFGRIVTAKQTLPDDPILSDWFERCLDLYSGLGRSEPSFTERNG